MEVIQSLRPLLETPNVVLGLDAYGVMYDGQRVFDSVHPVLKFCTDHHIPFFMMTNNATHSIPNIIDRMANNHIILTDEQIISSGCACYQLDHVRAAIDGRNVFIYGYESSAYYATKANAIIVSDPFDADTILLMASLNHNNHLMYKRVHDAVKHDPGKTVICLNPDHYVYYESSYMPVMGYYASQLQAQLQIDIQWVGKPYSTFSALVRTVLERYGYAVDRLVFCDDNPFNVGQMVADLDCTGCVITDTGIYHKYRHFESLDSKIYKLSSCKL